MNIDFKILHTSKCKLVVGFCLKYAHFSTPRCITQMLTVNSMFFSTDCNRLLCKKTRFLDICHLRFQSQLDGDGSQKTRRTERRTPLNPHFPTRGKLQSQYTRPFLCCVILNGKSRKDTDRRRRRRSVRVVVVNPSWDTHQEISWGQCTVQCVSGCSEKERSALQTRVYIARSVHKLLTY